jgi:hypothetical protein
MNLVKPLCYRIRLYRLMLVILQEHDKIRVVNVHGKSIQRILFDRPCPWQCIFWEST